MAPRQTKPIIAEIIAALDGIAIAPEKYRLHFAISQAT